MDGVVAVYTDGGNIGKNPSEIGGTWAWVGIDRDGNRVIERSGVLLVDPKVVEISRWVSNNHAEFWAVCKALAALPDGWSGTLFTDSSVIQTRFRNAWMHTKKGKKFGGRVYAENTPRLWMQWFWKHLARLGEMQVVLVPGHEGVEHNERCDTLCNRERLAWEMVNGDPFLSPYREEVLV